MSKIPFMIVIDDGHTPPSARHRSINLNSAAWQV